MDEASDGSIPTAAAQPVDGSYETDDADRSTPGTETTGVDAVDRVLAEVAAVTGAPVGDHVQVFERAHDQLRRALDAPAESVADAERGA
jgi:hypothetical protein